MTAAGTAVGGIGLHAPEAASGAEPATAAGKPRGTVPAWLIWQELSTNGVISCGHLSSSYVTNSGHRSAAFVSIRPFNGGHRPRPARKCDNKPIICNVYSFP